MITIETKKIADNVYNAHINKFNIESIGYSERDSVERIKFKLQELYDNLKNDYLKTSSDVIRSKILYIDNHWKKEPYFIYEIST